MSKNSFILHNDSLDVLDELTNEQAGMLLKAMRAFHCGEELELDTLTKIVFSPFKNQFDRDEVKYQKIVDRNKTNGLKGGRPPNPVKAKEPTGLIGNPSKPKQPDSVNDSVSVNGSVSVSVKEDQEIKPRKLSTKRNTKIPDDFCITGKMREWSLSKNHHIDIDEETENFKLYWKGCGKAKADWVATWQVWMNKNNKDTMPRQTNGSSGYSKITQQNLIEAEKWERSFDQ